MTDTSPTRRQFLFAAPSVLVGLHALMIAPPGMRPAAPVEPTVYPFQVLMVHYGEQPSLLCRHYWPEGEGREHLARGVRALDMQFDLFGALFGRDAKIERTQHYITKSDYFDVTMVARRADEPEVGYA